MAGALAEADTKTGLTVEDLVTLGETDLRVVVALGGRAQRELDALNTRTARALKILEGTGSGPAADDVLRGEGKVSAKKAKRQAARAETAERFPEVGKAIDNAEANSENVDTLARVTENMSPGEMERMNALGAEIASYASTSSPEQFARYIKRLVLNIKDPAPGPSIAERQKAASRLTLKRGFDGMWDINGRLDPERARVINDLLRRRAAKIAGNRPITPNDMATALFDLTTSRIDDKDEGQGDGDDVGRPAARMGIGYIVDADTLFHYPPASTTDSQQRPHETWPTDTPDACPNQRTGRQVSETWEGDDVESVTVQRLACNADL